MPLFNGRDLAGWEGDSKLWIVEDGMLVGRSPGIKYNDFLATVKTYGDFILRFQIRLLDNRGNSGVQFRSQRVPPPSHEVSGYQADVLRRAGGASCMTKLAQPRSGRPATGPAGQGAAPADRNDYA